MQICAHEKGVSAQSFKSSVTQHNLKVIIYDFKVWFKKWQKRVRAPKCEAVICLIFEENMTECHITHNYSAISYYKKRGHVLRSQIGGKTIPHVKHAVCVKEDS
jgi:hypothetical protein